MSKTWRILSIDGGGIRGVVPALLLWEIEKKTGARIADLFDLIAGTSTGGLIALALSRPHADATAEALVNLYKKRAVQIFPPSLIESFLGIENESLRSALSLLCPKYTTNGLEEVLDEIIGDDLVKDARTELVITSYDVTTDAPFLMNRRLARTNIDFDIPMKLAARATSAAPAYFEPVKHRTTNPPIDRALIDGGLYANNPCGLAIREAKEHLSGSTDELFVLSIGTGYKFKSIKHETCKSAGGLWWSTVALRLLMKNSVRQTHEVISSVLSDSSNYYRWQLEIPEELIESLDCTKSVNISLLSGLVGQICLSAEFETVCKRLVQIQQSS